MMKILILKIEDILDVVQAVGDLSKMKPNPSLTANSFQIYSLLQANLVSW